MFGAGSGHEARSIAPAGIAVKGELADDQHLAALIDDGAIHLPVAVFEHAELPELVCQLDCLRLGVIVRDADQHTESSVDRADDRAVDRNRCSFDSLDHCPHLISVPPDNAERLVQPPPAPDREAGNSP